MVSKSIIFYLTSLYVSPLDFNVYRETLLVEESGWFELRYVFMVGNIGVLSLIHI